MCEYTEVMGVVQMHQKFVGCVYKEAQHVVRVFKKIQNDVCVYFES